MSTLSAQGPILVQLIEPHRTMRYGLRVLLESQPRIRVVDEVESIAAALASAVARIDIVVLNADTRGALSSLTALAGPSARTRVVVLTRDAERAPSAIRLGAATAMMVDEAADKLVRVIEALHRDQVQLLS